ncbi:MAG: mycofactocin biosynthesis chaperone MftB [Ilumatobacteraceae bacterium]|nr:mycofactocin biosynthesis chaperone MftB [Ilumatobacteraceae bacterium]
MLNSPLKLHPSVALRPEPFGALAYHYDNRRLIFLKHPSIVDVVKDLHQYPDLQSALCAHGIEERHWDAYDNAICSLIESDVVVPQ